MKIPVKKRHYGFWSTTPITVRKVEDGFTVYCNHDGAELEDFEDYYGHKATREYCDKCEAWRDIGEEEWHDAPTEGEA